MSSGRTQDEDKGLVQEILDQQLASIRSREIAESTLSEMLKRAGGSEAERSDSLSTDRAAFVRRVTEMAASDSGPDSLAQILVELTAHALSRSEAASTASAAAHAVFGAGPPSLSEAAQRGRDLLRAAVLDNMHQLERAEAQVFVGLNGLPQPDWMRKLGKGIEFLATGGRMWIAGALLAAILRAPNSVRSIMVACPIVALAAIAVEWMAKPLFVRWRSFRHAVAMMLLGVRPRRRSFPSGHAASAWAGALLFSRIWPARRGVFVLIAGLVSVSRVYLGAHGPGDVLVGSLVGLVLAELLRRPFDLLAVRFGDSTTRRLAQARRRAKTVASRVR